MSDGFSQFHHGWTDRGFVMDTPPHGSTDQEFTKNGHRGAKGADGTTGNSVTPPGAGQDGGDGRASHNLLNTGAALVFHKANPLGQWTIYSDTGLGGDGGKGGNAGAFDPSADTGPWPGGGSGGDGGNSGRSTAQLDGHTVWGHRGGNSDDGIFLQVYGQSNDAGKGGDGGNGDGEGGPVNAPGGNGGNGGDGGNAGDATVNITNNAFNSVGTAGDIQMYISGITNGGDGGDGGLGGVGGLGGSLPAGADGTGGVGGNGAHGTIVFQNNTFDLSGPANGTSTLYIEFLAYAGDGGTGGSTAGNPAEHSALGGLGGSSSITMRNIAITGGAEDDIIGIDLENFTGSDGAAGDGTYPFHNGSSTIVMKNVTVEGGGGHNTLGFAVSVNQSGFAVTVNLVNHSFFVNGAKAGTVSHIDDVVGAGLDDYLIGDASNNVLAGGSGSDRLHGGGGADTFYYVENYASWGYGFDSITDMNFSADKISTPYAVKHIDATITGANLHSGDAFIGGMTTALSGGLPLHHAVLVEGSYDNGSVIEERTFLVVDTDGVAGYSYEDMVIDVTGFSGHLHVGSFVDHAI